MMPKICFDEDKNMYSLTLQNISDAGQLPRSYNILRNNLVRENEWCSDYEFTIDKGGLYYQVMVEVKRSGLAYSSLDNGEKYVQKLHYTFNGVLKHVVFHLDELYLSRVDIKNILSRGDDKVAEELKYYFDMITRFEEEIDWAAQEDNRKVYLAKQLLMGA